jgi:hypothetical protein
MKYFAWLCHKEIEGHIRIQQTEIPHVISFWLLLLPVCLLEAVAGVIALRRELFRKEKDFTVDNKQG